MPVDSGFLTRGRAVTLGPYDTESVEYAFYFPTTGHFTHFPAHVSKHEQLVAAARAKTLNVVEALSEVDTTSWESVSQRGTQPEVLAYLAAHNVDRLDLSRIAWRMQDATHFAEVLDQLRARHVYDNTLWSYALKHGHAVALGEYMCHQGSFLRSAGRALPPGLMEVNPVERGWHEHLEYQPLTNARAHCLGSRTQILNSALDTQYRRFLDQAKYQPQLDSEQLLAATYYLFVQDRVEAGLEMLARVDPAEVACGLQYDYLRAYAAMFAGDAAQARELAQAHQAHPVERWRKLFENILAHLDEAQGAGSRVVDEHDRQQSQAALAAGAASFELEVADRRVQLSYRNLTHCQVNYFPMDIELLFSRQPFVQQDSERFGVIMPTRRDELALPKGAHHRFELPEEFHSANVIVEVVAQGARKAHASYANDLNIHLVQSYGQLRVRHRKTHKPLPVVYVKVFARHHDGEVSFYKDGYTDLRGYFDYATLSTDQLDGVERFALLVCSEHDGAVIREAAPPQR